MGEQDRDVTSVLAVALLHYLARALGPEAAAEVVEAAGMRRDDPRLTSTDQWLSAAEFVALTEAANDRCGDPGLGRRVGEEYFRLHEADGTVEFLRAAATPTAALEVAAAYGTRMSRTRSYECRDPGATSLVIDSYADEASSRYDCQIACGYWARIPSLFGAVGTVVEPRCTNRGDDRCEMVVRWDHAAALPQPDQDRSKARADETIARFEELQSTATEMAKAETVRGVLESIIQRVSTATMAPCFVLTVRRSEDAEPDVLSIGMSDADASRAAAALWGEGAAVPDLGSSAVAEVASDRRHHGYLAAYLPGLAQVTDIDRRLLRAYAGHATAALERVLALEAAQRDHQVATALLRLAQTLAGARSIAEIADQVTAAVVDVVGCDVAGVWLLDDEGSTYRLESVTDTWPHSGPRTMPAPPEDALRAIAEDPTPFVFTRGQISEEVEKLLVDWGVDESCVAPIVHRGRLHGLLVASAQGERLATDQGQALTRLAAMANHASTAIGNTLLLEQIRHQALHDALTGLPNRVQIEEHARAALGTARRAGTGLALAFVDLDRFKNVNDTLGHAAGDELIRKVAQRLERCVRTTDVVARLGGDEFLVMLPDVVEVADAEAVVEKILEALQAPFTVSEEQLFISASVGIACSPEHGRDYGTLLSRADAAMYEAKARGRNRYSVHARAVHPRNRSLLKLENELHLAVERGQLRVAYQPQVDLQTEQIVAAEALVRWEHPTMGEVGPPTFLAIAEESGLIVDIDRWVRRTAFSQAKAWVDRGTPIRVAVNLSSRDLQNPCFPDEVAALMGELEVPAGLVELEVTDRVVMDDDDLPRWLEGLRSLGVRLAVDDFGTGNSVLSRLHACPVDVLKIDRSFIDAIAGPDADTRLVHALVSMSHALGMEVVSEGIELESQAETLRSFGCDLGQGFRYHRPMPAEVLGPLLASRSLSGAVPS